MSWWWFVALTVATLTACGQPEQAAKEAKPLPPVELRASLDKAVATTGDLLTYTVAVEHEPGISVEVPEVGAEIAGLRILDSEIHPPEDAEGRVLRRRTYTLRADLVGSYVLPEVTVKYTPKPAKEGDEPPEPVEVKTSQIFLEVKSVLPKDGSATDIREIKALQRPEFGVSPYLWVIAALLGLLLVAALLVGWRYRRKQRRVPHGPPPHEAAFAALDGLRGVDFDDPEEVRRYYFAISEIFRCYVEDRFGLNATDLTSQEILARLDELGGLHNEERILVRSFLTHTDVVKFADHRPAPEEIRERYDEALQFIQRTIPRPDPGQTQRRAA